jgi:hypothetical protein
VTGDGPGHDATERMDALGKAARRRTIREPGDLLAPRILEPPRVSGERSVR